MTKPLKWQAIQRNKISRQSRIVDMVNLDTVKLIALDQECELRCLSLPAETHTTIKPPEAERRDRIIIIHSLFDFKI